MSLTVQQLLADARRLSTRLKEHDQSADQLLSRGQEVLKEVDAMRQYQENIENLNELAHNRPRAHLVLGIQQENRHIRSLQQENKELRAALEEHQSALELIMSKYREHITSMIKCSGKLDCSSNSNNQLILEKTEKVCEMAAVMKEAVRRDEEIEGENQELIARLYTENKGLREMLGISAKHRSLPSQQRKLCSVDQGIQTEDSLTSPDRTEDDEDGLDVEVTLPMPAPPPRANRSAAAAAGQHAHPAKPVTPEVTENESRLSASPVDPSNSASESDETSDDDSVKFDTIKKYSRRVTAVPANLAEDTSKMAAGKSANEPVGVDVDDSAAATAATQDDLSNKMNNNNQAPAESSKTTTGAAVIVASAVDNDNNANSTPDPQATTTTTPQQQSPPSAILSPQTTTTTTTSGNQASAAASTDTTTAGGVVDAAAKNSVPSSRESPTAATSQSSAAISNTAAVADNNSDVSVTNCESILNDIITDSVNSSKR